MTSALLASAPETPARRATSLLSCTPGLVLGPYYPLHGERSDGTCLFSAERLADSQSAFAVQVSGRLLDRKGRPVARALVEAWQADEQGRYRHSSAPDPAPGGEGFIGYAAQRTDELGRYCFRTLKPGAYVAAEQTRAPHIHFQVTGARDRLVTQMFFPEEATNLADRFYASVPDPQRLVATLLNRTPLVLVWDIVLRSG